MEKKSIVVEVEGGRLIATASLDPEYPGIDVEFVPNQETCKASTPRILIEQPKGENLRALVWGNPDKEDYTVKVEFDSTDV